MAVKTFAEMATEALAEAGAALGNLQLHPGWPVMLDLLERMEHSCLVRLGECDEGELRRLQGERDAVSTFRRLLTGLPRIAAERLEDAVEDGEVSDEELARFSGRVGDGDLRL